MPAATMLRIHLMQQWYALSDPAMEDALYEIEAMPRFYGRRYLSIQIDTNRCLCGHTQDKVRASNGLTCRQNTRSAHPDESLAQSLACYGRRNGSLGKPIGNRRASRGFFQPTHKYADRNQRGE